MLRAIGTNKQGNPTVLLGLEEENFTRLSAGDPIRVNLKNFAEGQTTDLPDIDVVIFVNNKETEHLLKSSLFASYLRENT